MVVVEYMSSNEDRRLSQSSTANDTLQNIVVESIASMPVLEILCLCSSL